MCSRDASLSERVNTSFKQLSVAATQLNAVSDELGKSISELDSALKRLNLGVSAWVAINAGNDLPEDGYYWSEDIGYDKINTKWGIAIRTVSGHYMDPHTEHCERWLFSGAPRGLRVAAVAKIPDLIEKLKKEADATTMKIKEKIDQARQLAAAINELAPESTASKRKQPGGRQ